MSRRFILFVFAGWYPLLTIATGLLCEHYANELRDLSLTAILLLEYLFVLTFFAPLLWHAFIRKSK